ncbi:MAG: hypothetical protein NZ576_11900, partial [Bacteroidia bacterium]|nr:hypothetical protein [Bacteroidia bacterium]
MKQSGLLKFIMLAFLGTHISLVAQQNENSERLMPRGWGVGKGKNVCVIKVLEKGDSSQVKVYRLTGDGVKDIFTDSIRKVILEKGVNSPEF